jgi:uncharacterized DUF497 family protein
VFEWDADKAVGNLSKHGVSFDEAATVLADPNGLDGPDFPHSTEESPSCVLVGRRSNVS